MKPQSAVVYRFVLRAVAPALLIIGLFGASAADAQRRRVQPRAAPQMTVHYIDVDQGSAALLEFPAAPY